jgi:chorismate-pyruvate lyase
MQPSCWFQHHFSAVGESMPGGISRDDAKVEIEALLGEFYDPEAGFEQLGRCTAVDSVPAPYNELLDHHEHMTVTVESHHGDKVNVVVHRHHRHRDATGDWYAREITLVTAGQGKVVQYGIVRLDVSALDPAVWERIESREVPLGRVLIEHNVLREVQLCQLWRIESGPSLATLLQVDVGDVVYGRTALIFCDGEPAIELLEIVAK